VQPVQRPITEFDSDGLNREVGRPRSRLLETGAALLVLVAVVIQIVSTPMNAPVLVTANAPVTFKSTPRTIPFSGASSRDSLSWRSVNLVLGVVQRSVQIELVVLLVVLSVALDASQLSLS